MRYPGSEVSETAIVTSVGDPLNREPHGENKEERSNPQLLICLLSNLVMTRDLEHHRVRLSCLCLTSSVFLPDEYQEIPPGIAASVGKTCL